MFGIGPEEIVLVLIVALLVLGPERLPRVARDVGKVVGDLRRTSDEFREEFLHADKFLERSAASPPAPPAEPASLPGGAAPVAAPTATDRRPETQAVEESAFDREMREARERLAASREKTET